MLRVGLTGNVASGKSTVARVWRDLGLVVIDADRLARQAVEPGSDGLERIRRRFGADVIDREGGLDRAALRRIVFADPEARRALEGIVHPEVQRLRAAAEREAVEGGAAVVVHEIPLLFEVGLADEFDVVVLIDAPADVRLRRIVAERGLLEDEARGMIAAQMPAEAKRARADVVVENTATVAQLEREAARIGRSLLERAAAD